MPSCGHTTPHSWAEPCQRCPLPHHTILGLGVSGRDVPSPACLSPGIRRTGTSTVSLPGGRRDEEVTPLCPQLPTATKAPCLLLGPGVTPLPQLPALGARGAVQGGFKVSTTVSSCSTLPRGQLRTELLPTAGQHLPRHGSPPAHTAVGCSPCSNPRQKSSSEPS